MIKFEEKIYNHAEVLACNQSADEENSTEDTQTEVAEEVQSQATQEQSASDQIEDLTQSSSDQVENLEAANNVYLSIMEDLQEKTVKLEESQEAFMNLMDDLEKQKAESEEARAFVVNILRVMSEMVVVLNPDGTINMINPSINKTLGFTQEELLGADLEKILIDVGKVKAIILNRTEEDSIDQADKVFLTKTGEKIPVLFSISKMLDKNNAITGFVCVASDITDRKIIEDEIKSELKDATSQLVQSEKLTAIGELTAGVCHELNQPLNVMKIISQSAQREMAKGRYTLEDIEKDFPDILEQVNKAREIIDHMRLFSRNTDSSEEKVKRVINTVVESALKFIGAQLKTHQIELVQELDPNLPPILCDPIRLEQVFLNIVTNARLALEKCTKEGAKCITIKSYRKEDMVVVEIQDNGPGIPDKIKEKIFNPFFTTRKQGEGTGLGLSISTKIIAEHKGKIELDSEENSFTVFRIIIPAVCEG